MIVNYMFNTEDYFSMASKINLTDSKWDRSISSYSSDLFVYKDWEFELLQSEAVKRQIFCEAAIENC